MGRLYYAVDVAPLLPIWFAGQGPEKAADAACGTSYRITAINAHSLLVAALPHPVYYTIASGTLLVINKVAIVKLPAPTFLLLTQLLFSAGSVYLAHLLGVITIQKATNRQLLHFLPVVVGFIGTIYSNIKVLQHSNVETFITFRSSTPLVLSFFDWALLGRQLPTKRSWAALAVLLMSSAGYAYYDKRFVVNAYAWLSVWCVRY